MLGASKVLSLRDIVEVTTIPTCMGLQRDDGCVGSRYASVTRFVRCTMHNRCLSNDWQLLLFSHHLSSVAHSTRFVSLARPFAFGLPDFPQIFATRGVRVAGCLCVRVHFVKTVTTPSACD